MLAIQSLTLRHSLVFFIAWTLAPSSGLGISKKRKLSYRAYALFQEDVLHKIGTSKRRIVVATSLLGDRDIAASLFLAKYRGVQVSIYLPRQKQPLFILKTLQHNHIKLRPLPLKKDLQGSMIVFDDKTWVVDTPLSPPRHRQSLRGHVYLGSLSPKQWLEGKIDQVTKPKVQSNNPKAPQQSNNRTATQKQTASNTPYRYQPHTEKAAAKIPRRLPRKPLWQKQAEQRKKHNASTH